MSAVVETRIETRIERRPIKKPRACAHCHVRKVRCDAWQVGLPCTRCQRRNQTRTCALAPATLLARQSRNPGKQPHQGSDAAHSVVEEVESELCDLASRSPQTHSASATDPVLDQAMFRASSERYTGGLETDQRSDASSRDGVNSLTLPTREDGEQISTAPSLEDCDSDLGPPTINDDSIAERDVHLWIADEISRGSAAVVSPSDSGKADGCCEVIEYHEGVTPITIVGGALRGQVSNRLTRVKLRESAAANARLHSGSSRLKVTDLDYLERRGVLQLPSRSTCIHLLRLYFKCVHPYAPILDPAQFTRDYLDGSYSHFLIQSIFANVVPHASLELLKEMGYQDRRSAQQGCYTKATLLYDLGQETRQIHRLQGSIMLSSLCFSYAVDKDYRYWFSNACRIGTQIGLHRQYISERLDAKTKKLFRRIWWILYNRDVLMVVSGLSNLRKFDDRFCDTAALTEDDWPDEEIPEDLNSILVANTQLQKVYLVENCKLASITSRFLAYFTLPGGDVSSADIQSLENEIVSWKKQLDPVLCTSAHEWTVDNIWVLVLLATSYRLEAVFYRWLRDHFRHPENDPAMMSQVRQKQENAMFELSSIIQRASLHGVLGLAPLSFMTCASTILAMRIEIALDPTTNAKRRFSTRIQIAAEIEYLREACQHWISLSWTLRMFEVVISRMGLNIDDDSSVTSGGRANGTTPSGDGSGNPRPGPEELAPVSLNETGLALNDNLNFQNDFMDLDLFEDRDEFFGVLPMTGNYDWIEGLLAPHSL